MTRLVFSSACRNRVQSGYFIVIYKQKVSIVSECPVTVALRLPRVARRGLFDPHEICG